MADPFEECEYSGLARIFCAHCKGDKLGDEEEPPKYGDLDPDDDDFEVIGRAFEAKYRGHCTLNYDHKIRVGSRVARVQRANNPMIPVAGVACNDCIRQLPHAKT